MASGESFINSSIRSLSPSKLVRPGQCSSVIWLNKPICCCRITDTVESQDHMIDVDMSEKNGKQENGTYSNNLPEETEHKVLLAFTQIVSVDVDDIATNRLGRVEG